MAVLIITLVGAIVNAYRLTGPLLSYEIAGESVWGPEDYDTIVYFHLQNHGLREATHVQIKATIGNGNFTGDYDFRNPNDVDFTAPRPFCDARDACPPYDVEIIVLPEQVLGFFPKFPGGADVLVEVKAWVQYSWPYPAITFEGKSDQGDLQVHTQGLEEQISLNTILIWAPVAAILIAFLIREGTKKDSKRGRQLSRYSRKGR